MDTIIDPDMAAGIPHPRGSATFYPTIIQFVRLRGRGKKLGRRCPLSPRRRVWGARRGEIVNSHADFEKRFLVTQCIDRMVLILSPTRPPT
jgi:hypothetical protein